MKMIFVVFENENGAIADTIKTGEDLLNINNRFNAKICHLCESRSEADKLARLLNGKED